MASKARAAVKASGFYAKWLPQLVTGKGTVPTSYGEFGRLARHLRFVERSSRKLARQTFYGMSRWQAGLEHRQGFLGRIVDIGAELFAMAAACSRAEMLKADDPAQGEAAYELADAFCAQSRVRVEELFDRLWRNTDDVDRQVASAPSTAPTCSSRRASSTRPRAPAPGSPPGSPASRPPPASPAATADRPPPPGGGQPPVYDYPIRWPSGSVNWPMTRPSITLSGPNSLVPPRLSALASDSSTSGTST